MPSFIGIILGLTLFVIFAFRGFNLILSAFGSVCIMFACSGISPMAGLKEMFLPGLAGFVQNYFLLFMFSALLGRLMSDSGTAKRIALSLAGVIHKTSSPREQRFFCLLLVPVLYFILCYVGISGFVVVFTVLPIAKDLFRQTDTPWRLYCIAGAQSISQAVLVGSLAACNIYAADVCGTNTTSGLKLSLIMVGIFWIVSLILLRWTLHRIEKKKEGFLPSGTAIQAASLDEGILEESLPGLIPSLLPMAAVVVLSAVFGLDVIMVLFLGCLLTIAAGWKNIKGHLKESLTAGVTSSYSPLLSVSATFAIGASLKGLAGFSMIESALSQMPPLLEGTGLGLLSSFIMASAAAPVASFGTQMLEKYTEAGLSAANAHRMMTLTSFTSIAPHNAGISNAAQVLRLPYAECIKVYIIYTYIPAFCSLAAAMLCLSLKLI